MKAEDSEDAGEHDHSGYLHNSQSTMLGVHWLIQRHEVEVAESFHHPLTLESHQSIVENTHYLEED